MTMDPVAWFLANTTWAQLPGYLGAILVIASFLMTRMIPLRALTMLSNICFIIYAWNLRQYPTLFLYALLLPLNVWRLTQMVRLVRRMRHAPLGENALTSLKPFMQRRRLKPGEILVRKGDVADALFYVVSGTLRVTEIGATITPGEFVGELGLLSPLHRRTHTLQSVNGGELLCIAYEHVTELYFQNPDFGFRFLQLTTSRLFHNLETLQQEVDSLKAGRAAEAAS